jgi:hypothetical protein
MKTEVAMKREIFGYEIRQKSKTEFFSATDLVNAGNHIRDEKKMSRFNLAAWLSQKSTQEFIEELKCNVADTIIIKGRGRSSSTWVHPYLLIDLAMSIDPKFKVAAIGWLHDKLLEYRNSSGDSYKKMTGAVYNTLSNKDDNRKVFQAIANNIKKACCVDDWQSATESQLKKRDKIHENISLLCDVLKNIDSAVDIAIDRAIKETNQ